MALSTMEESDQGVGDVEQLRQLGVSFEDQIGQHVSHAQSELQALMMTEFRRHFAAQYAGVLQTHVLEVKNTSPGNDTSPPVRIDVGELSGQTLAGDGAAGREFSFAVDIENTSLSVSVMSGETADATVLGQLDVDIPSLVRAGKPVEDWYGLTKDGVSTWRVFIKFTHVPSETFNVCHTNRFKLKVDHVLGEALEQIRAAAHATQDAVDQQAATIESLKGQIGEVNILTSKTVEGNKGELVTIQSVREEFLRSVAGSLLEMADDGSWPAVTAVLRLDISTATLPAEPSLFGLGYFITVTLGNRSVVTTTALNRDTPTWNTSVTLPLPLPPTSLLSIALHANTPSGSPSAVVACQTFPSSLWLPADGMTTPPASVKARLYPPQPTDAYANHNGILKPDTDQEPLCSLSMEYQHVTSPNNLSVDEMKWDADRHLLPLLVANIREQLTSKAAGLTARLKASLYEHTQMVEAVNDVADIVDPHTTLAALDRMQELVKNFDVEQLTAVGHVGGVRAGCLDAIDKLSSAVDTMLEPISEILEGSTVPETQAELVTPPVFNEVRGAPADDPILELLDESLGKWAAQLGQTHLLVESSAVSTLESHAACVEMNAALKPLTGRLHLHISTVVGLPVAEIGVGDKATVVALVDVQEQTYETAPVLIGSNVVLNAHLVIDVLDLPTTSVAIRVCVCPPLREEGGVRELLLVGTGRLPLVNIKNGESVQNDLPLKQPTRSYATYGTVSTSLVFAEAQDPAELLRSEYTARATQLTEGYAAKIERLETQLESIAKDQAAVSKRAADLTAEKAQNDLVNTKLEDKIRGLEDDLRRLKT